MFGPIVSLPRLALVLAAFMTLALPTEVRAQAWALDQERGVGGSSAAAPANPAAPKQSSADAESDVVDQRDGSIVLQAEAAQQPAHNTPANSDQVPRPAARPSVVDGVVQPAAIEQVQLAPNIAAEPKTIVPPRGNDTPSTGAVPSVIIPSPPRPADTEASLQQALLTPGVAASPKETVLRTAPVPDNRLVELVETPTDYSLSLSVGKGQLLNLGKSITDVFVADPNIADVNVFSPTQVSIHGNQLGRTNVFGIDASGDVVFAVDIDVVPDAGAAQKELKAVLPATKAEVSLRSGTLIAEGAVADVGEAIDVANVTESLRQTQGPTLNNTTISGSQQVNIRVRFAEVSRNDTFNLGINWEALVDTGDFLFGLASGPGAVAAVDAFGSIFGSAEFGDVNVEAFIDALQREGIINLLAEPNLTAINGEAANFLAGGEIPIPVPGGAGGDTVTIDYKPFGVSLDFIPTLLPGERINLRVRPEVSSITNAGGVFVDGFAIPAFTVRRAETSVELASGQTFAIAGLFQRDLATNTEKFPVLGDVPVIGQLFQSQRFQRSETELVILITPYLVKPVSNRNVALPNDRLRDPVGSLANKSKKRAGFIVN
ncbi:MAG: pilus assembly protein N-terminal domain-containing protein [Geminicoccaceae bacterium]